MDSHCGILWYDNSGADLGCHPTKNYAEGLDNAEKQAIISQQRLRSNMLGLWINNSLTTDYNCKLRDSKSEYILNAQYDGSEMLFVILKMVLPDTHTGC